MTFYDRQEAKISSTTNAEMILTFNSLQEYASELCGIFTFRLITKDEYSLNSVQHAEYHIDCLYQSLLLAIGRWVWRIQPKV
jgi:hypothetical protein